MRWKNKESNITFPLYPARRLPMLAPPRRQSLDPPPGHANRARSSPEGSLLFLPTGALLRQRAPSSPKGPYRRLARPFKSKFVGSRGTKSEK